MKKFLLSLTLSFLFITVFSQQHVKLKNEVTQPTFTSEMNSFLDIVDNISDEMNKLQTTHGGDSTHLFVLISDELSKITSLDSFGDLDTNIGFYVSNNINTISSRYGLPIKTGMVTNIAACIQFLTYCVRGRFQNIPVSDCESQYLYCINHS